VELFDATLFGIGEVEARRLVEAVAVEFVIAGEDVEAAGH